MDLIAFDMNGVLTEKYLAYVLSEKYAPQGLPSWKLYRQGELDTTDFIHFICGTHKGLPYSLIDEEAQGISPVEHSLELMRAVTEGGFRFAIASADYGNLVRRTESALAPYQPVLSFGNEAVCADGVHTGIMKTPVVNGMEKARRVDGIKASDGTKRLITIGNDTTCRELFCISNVSVAFNSQDDDLRRRATYCIDDGDLLDVVELLGRI